MNSEKKFRPLTRNEFEIDDEANKEVQNIISGYEDEKRKAREAHEAHQKRLRAQADDANRILREYHEREKQKEQGLCNVMGGRIKNILRKKNNSKRPHSKNKYKSKRINKKRYSRKSFKNKSNH